MKQEQPPLERLKEKLGQLYPPETVKHIWEGFSKDRKTTLRINTLKTSIPTFLEECASQHIIIESVNGFENAFVLITPSLREFTETNVYKEGKCYVQSLSSMVPAFILDPLENEKILDICAAPGSKTSQIAMLMNNTGEIVANDASHTRIYRLKANLSNLGVTNTTVLRTVGQGLWHDYPEYFDKTLVDVPCSMEGRIQLSDEKSYQDWSPKKIKELQEIQKFLLRSAISATKPGGTIVYSTCTLSPEENEKVIEWILKKEKDSIVIESIGFPDIPWSKALTEVNGQTLPEDIQKTKRILPSELFEGFYIAKLKKIQSTI